MPYNPGISDISGQLRAQGMLAGGQGLLQGLTTGVDILQKNKEKEKEYQAAIKNAELMAKSLGSLAGQINPEFENAIKELSLKTSDPNVSTRERAMLSQNALKTIGDLMNTGIALKKEQNAEAQRQQMAQAQIAADRMRQQKDQFDNTVRQLVGFGASNGFTLPREIIGQVGPEAYGAAMIELQKVGPKAAGAQTYPTLAEAQAAAQALKPITGTVPTVKYENGAYVVETVGKAQTEMDPIEKGRAGLIIKGVEKDIEQGEIARRAMPAVNRLSALLESGKVDTGTFAKTKNDIRSLGKALNIEVDEEKLANTQEAEAYAGRFLLDAIQFTKGSVSDKENQIFQSFGPELSKDPETNKRIVRMTKDRLDLDQKVERLAQQWKTGKIDVEQLNERREALIEEYDRKIEKIFAGAPTSINQLPALSPEAQKFLR